MLPPHWSAVRRCRCRRTSRRPAVAARLVLFRRPLEHRAEDLRELEALLLTVIVEQVADVLGVPPEEVLPGYEART